MCEERGCKWSIIYYNGGHNNNTRERRSSVMIEYELTFEQEKETKNTVRFQEQVVDGEQAVIGPLYIQKHALGNEPPKTLTVTVS